MREGKATLRGRLDQRFESQLCGDSQQRELLESFDWQTGTKTTDTHTLVQLYVSYRLSLSSVPSGSQQALSV